MDEDAGTSNHDTEVVLTTPSLVHSLKDTLAMRTHLAPSVVAVVVLSILCGCSSGRGNSWSMASMNPFKSSSKKLADTTAPRFEKPSASANPADSLPPASGYASTSNKSPSSSGTYPEKTASYSGYNGMARSGYQSGQSSYSSTAPSSSAGYNALSSSSPAVSPQHGYYGSGTDYNTASRSNSSAPGYSYSGTGSPPGSAESSSYSYGSSRDSAYQSTGRDTASADGYSSYGSRTDSNSRYATGAERWDTGGSAASGYDYPNSGSADSGSSYPSSSSPASPWGATSPPATGSTSNDSLRYGNSTGSYDAAPFADRYSSNKGNLSDSTPGSSLRDRYANAFPGSSSSGSSYGYDSTSSSPLSEPATVPDERAPYVPGQTGYDPGNTGYKPPGTSSYQLPAGNYTPPGTTGGSESGYSPGSIDRYRTGGTSGSSPMGTYPSSSGSQSGSSYGYSLPPSR